MDISDEVLFLGLAILTFVSVMLAYVILAFGLCISTTFIFSVFIAFYSAMHKFTSDPEGYLEETDKLWLVIVSPFHKLESRRRQEFCGACGKLKLAALGVTELLLFLPSLIGGAVCLTPEIICKEYL